MQIPQSDGLEPSGKPRRSGPRVVSLLPSATEMLCAVGGRHLLVGRSHECDFPHELSDVPIVTRARIGSMSAGQTPAQIDAQVRAALQCSQSGSGVAATLYELFADRLAALAPDIILTQDVCEVCAIDVGQVRQVAAGLATKPEVVSLNPQTVEGVLDDCLRVAQVVGLGPAGTRAVVRLRERLYEAGEFVNPYDEGAVLAFLEWTDPLYCAGHWTVQLIERAGCRHPFNPTAIRKKAAGAAMGPQQGERVAGKSVRMTAEAVVAAAPEFVVVCPCGLDLAHARRCAEDLARQTWWAQLPAVKRGRVAIVDGNQYFNRPGPRLVEAFEWLVGWVQGRGEMMPRGFGWEGWGG